MSTGNKPERLQKVWGSIFGVVIIVLLVHAYFARDNSVNIVRINTLRVGLALAAGAFASVMTGFIHIEARAKGKFATAVIRAGGGMAVFVLVFLFNPPAQMQIAYLSARMEANWETGNWDLVQWQANEVLKLDPMNSNALNSLGSAAFHKGEYDGAVRYFKSALEQKPDDVAYKYNLASALIEVGNSQSIQMAVDYFGDVHGTLDGDTDAVELARALVYSGRYEDALEYVKGISDKSDRGSARIFEATAYMGLVNESDPATQDSLRNLALDRMRRGIAQNPEYWTRVLCGGDDPDHHLRYTKVHSLLTPLYMDSLAMK